MSFHRNFADTQQAALSFAVQQASHIEAGVYQTQYPELDYASLIPVDTSAAEWVKSVTYYSSDAAGAAQWLNGNGKDIPTVGFNLEDHETAVHTAGIGYDYGLEEVNQARLLGVPLESDKASAARRASEQLTYDVAFTGDAAKGFEGLFATTGVPTQSILADGTGASALWADKTPDQIIRDVNSMLIGMQTDTNTVEMADTLIMPVERYQYLASTRLTDSDTTILEFIRANNVYTAETGRPLTIRGKRGLLTAGTGSTARMVAYRRSPEVLKLHIPMMHRFLPVQIEGLRFVIPGIFRLGGVDIRRPKAVRYGDGI